MDDVWQMKKPGCAGVTSPVPMCGYSAAQLASLKKAGWRLYKNGKLWKGETA